MVDVTIGRTRHLPLIAASIAVIVFGFGPLFVRAIDASSAMIVFWRVLLAIPVSIAVAYATALRANHPFIDGDKRVAFHAMLVFLRLHGLMLTATAAEATERMLALAAGHASEAELAAGVRSRV